MPDSKQMFGKSSEDTPDFFFIKFARSIAALELYVLLTLISFSLKKKNYLLQLLVTCEEDD